MEVNVEKTNQKNTNNSESFISDQSKDAGIEAQAKQKKKKRKKRKDNTNNDILDKYTHRSEHDTIHMP